MAAVFAGGENLLAKGAVPALKTPSHPVVVPKDSGVAPDDDGEKGGDTRPLVAIDTEHIVNRTGNMKADFSALVDHLKDDLATTGLYRVMDMEDACKAIRRDEMVGGVIGDGEDGGTGTRGPAFFVGMTITTFGLTSAASQNALTGAVSGLEQAKVALTLRVVDARTGEIVVSKAIDGSAQGSAAAASNLREQVLQAVSKTAAQKIVYEMVRLTPFRVLDVRSRRQSPLTGNGPV